MIDIEHYDEAPIVDHSRDSFSVRRAVKGVSYEITDLGDTDFTQIGAASNTVGITFKATSRGEGTGSIRVFNE